jgi:hypothetical protein
MGGGCGRRQHSALLGKYLLVFNGIQMRRMEGSSALIGEHTSSTPFEFHPGTAQRRPNCRARSGTSRGILRVDPVAGAWLLAWCRRFGGCRLAPGQSPDGRCSGLRWASFGAGHFGQPERLRRQDPAVAGDDAVLAVDQHRIGEAELAHRGGDLCRLEIRARL